MGKFGWSLPPGCGTLPGEEPDPPCGVCGEEVDDCKCQECPVCGERGRKECVAEHGLKSRHVFTRQDWDEHAFPEWLGRKCSQFHYDPLIENSWAYFRPIRNPACLVVSVSSNGETIERELPLPFTKDELSCTIANVLELAAIESDLRGSTP